MFAILSESLELETLPTTGRSELHQLALPVSAVGKEKLMTPAERRYIWFDQGVLAVVVTFAINVAIAWLVFRRYTDIPLRGAESLLGDTLATSWMLPVISTWIVSALTLREWNRGKLAAPGRARVPWNPWRVFGWATIAGLCGLATVGLLGWGVWSRSGVESLPLRRFIVFKATWAGLYAGAFCPLATWLELRRARRLSAGGLEVSAAPDSAGSKNEPARMS